MDPQEVADFANQLGHLYQLAGQRIADYLTNNIQNMSKPDIDLVTDDQSRIVSYANSFYSLSQNIAFQDCEQYFDQVKGATGQITDALNHIATVNEIIGIAAGVITLAAAILSGNGQGIATAVGGIIGTIAGGAGGQN